MFQEIESVFLADVVVFVQDVLEEFSQVEDGFPQHWDFLSRIIAKLIPLIAFFKAGIVITGCK